MMRLRPSLSARWEEKGATRRAKREVEEVMMDLSKEVRRRLDREVSMETRVADITPVSSGKVRNSQLPARSIGRSNSRKGFLARDCRDVHPNRSPLIPAETVSSHMNSPGEDLSAWPEPAGIDAPGSTASSRSSPRSSGSRFAIRGACRLSISIGPSFSPLPYHIQSISCEE